MLKKFVGAALMSMAMPVMAAENVKTLPAPETEGGMPIMEAIAKRKTAREFSAKKINDQDLSNILFAAWGVSHDDKRTIPTARNFQKMNVYAVFDDEIWLYDGKENNLTKVGEAKDVMGFIAKQDFVAEAPLILIFTATPDERGYAQMHAGSAYQNVGLYCAAKGLNNVVRGMIDFEEIGKALGLKDEKVMITQTIGWPYM